MNLTEQDQKKIAEWIAQKCESMRCVCCGYAKWVLSEVATISIGFNLHTTRFHYHNGIPAVALVCANCGHMVFFNPNIMGIKPDEPTLPLPPVGAQNVPPAIEKSQGN